MVSLEASLSNQAWYYYDRVNEAQSEAWHYLWVKLKITIEC